MTKKCCVPNCRRQNDDPGCLNLHFFQLPSNEDKRKKWSGSLKNYFNKEFKFKKYSYICALHFEETCFHYGPTGKVLRLTQTSCPTIFEYHQHKEGDQSNYALQESSNLSSNNVPNSIEMHVAGNMPRVSLSPSLDTSSIQILETSDKEDVQENAFDARGHDLQNSQTNTSNESMDVVIFFKEENNSCKNSKNGTIKEVPTTLFNKSLVNIDLDSIDYENKSLVRKILEKAQADMRILRRKRRNQSMKLYRAKKRVLNGKSLISHVKQCNLISEKVSEILEVSMEK